MDQPSIKQRKRRGTALASAALAGLALLLAWTTSGGGTGYEAVPWFVSSNNHDDPNNLPLLRTMLFEYVPPPTPPSVLTTPGAYWANTDPIPASAD